MNLKSLNKQKQIEAAGKFEICSMQKKKNVNEMCLLLCLSVCRGPWKLSN